MLVADLGMVFLSELADQCRQVVHNENILAKGLFASQTPCQLVGLPNQGHSSLVVNIDVDHRKIIATIRP